VIYEERRTNAYNPTTIPPEWHGWINYINDSPPTSVSVVGGAAAVAVRHTAAGT
jgi:NADH:ubiquinone oxidoreductase subunit